MTSTKVRSLTAEQLGIPTRQPAPLQGLHIELRSWWRRGPGHHNQTARIFANGEQLAYLGPYHGHGTQGVHNALTWLQKQGLIPETSETGTRYLREVLQGTYSEVDVARERDL